MAQHAFLIPGYLAFRGKEGHSGYWDTVSAIFEACDVVPHSVATAPVGRISRRAQRLQHAIVSAFPSGLGEGDGIHLIGHSTGGLDSRYVVSARTPVVLPTEIRRHVRSVVTLSTPHHGTPVADFYYAWRAEDLVGLVARVIARWSTRDRVERVRELLRGSHARIQKLMPTAYQDEVVRVISGMIEATPEDLAELLDYVESLASDHGALDQLRMNQMKAFNLRVRDAPDVRYSSYVTGTGPPKIMSVGTAVYALGCFICSTGPHPKSAAWQPRSVSSDRVAWPKGLPRAHDGEAFVMNAALSDGVVPSLSQVWGELGGYVPVDHHAVVGRFDLLQLREFRQTAFRRLWTSIAEVLHDC